MPAALLAALAAVTGVAAVWDLLGALPGAAAAARRTLAPLGGAPTVGERRRAAALLACALLAAGWLVAGPVPALVLAAAAPLAARAVVAARRRRRRAELVAAAPLVARALADALSGGHSVRGALEAAAARGGIAGAAGAELRAVAGRLALGEKTDPALAALREAADAPAYDALVAAILLQRDAGGDLAALLRDLAGSLERAGRSAADARAVTAQARFTGAIVTALPLGALVLAELARPGLVGRILAVPPAAALLVVAAVLQLAGLVAMRALARVDP